VRAPEQCVCMVGCPTGYSSVDHRCSRETNRRSDARSGQARDAQAGDDQARDDQDDAQANPNRSRQENHIHSCRRRAEETAYISASAPHSPGLRRLDHVTAHGAATDSGPFSSRLRRSRSLRPRPLPGRRRSAGLARGWLRARPRPRLCQSHRPAEPATCKLAVRPKVWPRWPILKPHFRIRCWSAMRT